MAQEDRDGDKLVNYLTMVGHLCADLCQSAISAVLPFLVVAHGWSYTAVGFLVFASNVTSAVIQPLFGVIGDKRPSPWFMSLGVLMAGAGICCVGLFDDYWTIIFAAMLTGVGAAIYHPEGARLANLSAGTRKAAGMSIFAVGGNIGFFLGPLITAAFLTAFGMRGTVVFIVPSIACAAVLLFFNKRFVALGTVAAGEVKDDTVREHWGKFWLVMGLLSLRSIVGAGIVSFIPLFMLGPLGQPETISSLTLSAFAIAGAFATAISGWASSRWGVHKLTIACMVASTLLIGAFALNNSVVAAVAIAMLLSVFNNLFYPSSVALGMSYVPKHLGTASGLSYGVAISIGGMATPLLGSVGDTMGLVTVMLVLAGVSLAGTLVALLVAHADKR